MVFLTGSRGERHSHPMQRLALAAVVGAFLLGAAGCGPVISTYLSVAAQADLGGARARAIVQCAVSKHAAAS